MTPNKNKKVTNNPPKKKKIQSPKFIIKKKKSRVEKKSWLKKKIGMRQWTKETLTTFLSSLFHLQTNTP